MLDHCTLPAWTQAFCSAQHCFYPPGHSSMLEQISTLLENVETTVNLFVTLREQLSDDDWDLLNESPLLSQLLDSLSDLEYTIAD
jgi:hypothetical protein